ncbi:MAG TPA: DUF502 domain-containing protein [Vicinamibacterales bacterium]|nr:DUF502 domain-containing protein [Vicinamibacterales bacterium]
MAGDGIGQWLRRRFLAGFFVTVPLVISIAALVWIFGIIDDFTAPLATRLVGRAAPGVGILMMVLFVLAVGAVATNVIGRRILGRAEQLLTRVPVFKTIYSPVKQLVAAFSPDNEYGFKRVVMVEDERRGLVMGFLTKEFTVDRGQGPEQLIAVYVPTNHLYLGDIVLYPRARAFFPDMSVEEGIRIFLTGGMSLPGTIKTGSGAP